MGMYGDMRVLAVMMRKGGVGKTTIATAIAQYFGRYGAEALRGRRVLLMDMDTQQNASIAFLDMEEDPRFKGFVPPLHPSFNPNDPEDVEWGGRSSTADIFYAQPIEPYPVTAFPHLDILPSMSEQLQDVEMVRKEEVREKIYGQLQRFFNDPVMRENYGLVIVDTPPGEGAINRSVLRSCTDILVPTMPEEKSVQGMLHTLELISTENRFRETPINIVGIIPNLFDARRSLHHAKLREMEENPHLTKILARNDKGEALVIRNLADFPRMDLRGVKPDTLWELSESNPARLEAEALCVFVKERLYGAA